MNMCAQPLVGIERLRTVGRVSRRATVPVLTLFAFLTMHSAIQIFAIDGPSMQPGLHSGEYVAVNRLAYAFATPHRGDIILLHPPTAPQATFIKRVIGLPGDTITLTANSVLIDGHALREPYIYPITPGEVENDVAPLRFALSPGQYFVLGDHRQDSDDSRTFGPISRQDIIGEVSWLVWPLGET